MGPIQSEATKTKAVPAKQIIHEVMSSTGGGGTGWGGTSAGTGTGLGISQDKSQREDTMEEDSLHPKSTVLAKYSPSLIKQILELLCDESVRSSRHFNLLLPKNTS